MVLHGLHQSLHDEGVEATTEHRVATEEEVRLGAQGVQDAGHLHGDVARPQHGHLLGLLLQLEEAVAVDRMLHARDVGGGRNAATGH